MAFKLPEGLPKLSDITGTLSTPEAQFEKMVKEAAKIELPEGPLTMLKKFQKGFEAGGNPELPELPKIDQILARLPELPKLPELPSMGSSGEKGTEGSTLLEEKEVERYEARVLL